MSRVVQELEKGVIRCPAEIILPPIVSPENLWQKANLRAQKEGIIRGDGLFLDFTLSELPLKATVKNFADGEFLVQIGKDQVSGQKAAYFLSGVANSQMVSLLSHYTDALRQLGIQEITLVCPFLGFTRGDKPAPDTLSYVESRGLRALADIISTFADRIITVEPHSPETIRYFSQEKKIPVVAFSPWQFLTDVFLMKRGTNVNDNLVVIGPDQGRASAATKIGAHLNVPLVSLEKTRNPVTGDVTVKPLTEEQRQILWRKEIVSYDDVITSGSTLEKILAELEKANIKCLYVLACHGVFCGEAVKKMSHLLIEKIFLTDSRQPVNDLSPLGDKVRVIPLWPFLESIVEKDKADPFFNPWQHPQFSPIVCR